MGAKSIIFAVSLGILAIIIKYDALGIKQSCLDFIHDYSGDLCGGCPYHAALRVLSNLGIVSGSLSESKEIFGTGPGYSLSGVEIVRYADDYLFTKEELSLYKGTENSPGMYIGILGRVYDVQQGATHYAPGKTYHFFTGCDGTKAFMSGKFNEEGLIDEVTGLSAPQMIELDDWIAFYEKTYIYKGKVIGNFYDDQGKPKPALLKALEEINAAHERRQQLEAHKRIFPPCNSAHTKDGGWVSCSDKSGGIQREWVGVPRKYHTPGGTSNTCVCVRTHGPPWDSPNSDSHRGDLDNPHLEEYPGCDPEAESCKIR